LRIHNFLKSNQLAHSSKGFVVCFITLKCPIDQKTGVFSHFEITLEEEGKFGPEMISRVCQKYQVEKNNVFTGSIHDYHEFSYDDLGGVRIVLS
jgi:hypothetical protein